MQDLNLRPLPCEGSALATELIALYDACESPPTLCCLQGPFPSSGLNQALVILDVHKLPRSEGLRGFALSIIVLAKASFHVTGATDIVALTAYASKNIYTRHNVGGLPDESGRSSH